MPIYTRTREAILFHMWLPTELRGVRGLAFLALVNLEMASQVSREGVRRLAYLASFTAIGGSGIVFVSALFVLFRFRVKIRRDQKR